MSRRTPPRWLERRLERVLGSGTWTRSTLGDLAEGYHRLRERRGVLSSDLWYAVQAASLLVHRALGRGSEGGPGIRSGLMADLRWAVRLSVRRPLLTLGVVLTLGLGLGANAAMFSVIEGTFRATSWWADADRTLVLWPGHAFSRGQLSILDDDAPTYEAVGAYRLEVFTAAVEGGEPRTVAGASVSPELFARLRVQPTLGRGFLAEEAMPGGEPPVVVSRAFWLTELGGEPEAIGTRLLVNGEPRTVVGVQGPGGSAPGTDTDVWVPVVIDMRDPDLFPDISYTLVAVLRPGATAADGQEELRRFGRRLSGMFPFFFQPDYLQDGTVRLAADHERRLLGTPLLLLMGGTLALLLVAALNVGSMLLARSVERRGELAVRRALGAGRGRLVRQLAAEAALVAGLGTLLGVAVAQPAASALAGFFPSGVGAAESAWSSPRVLAFVLASALLAWAVLAGVPIGSFLAHERRGVATHLKASLAPRRGPVVVQAALATVLLVTASLLVGTVVNLRGVPLGFAPEAALVVSLSPPADFVGDRARLRGFHEDVVGRALGIAGVTAAGLTSSVPLAEQPPDMPVNPRGSEVDVSVAVRAARFAVDGGFFEAIGLRLEAGRIFGSTERGDQPSAVLVNRALAEALWPGEDPVGRSVAIDPHAWNRFVPIIGVVSDFRVGTLVDLPPPAFFVSLQESPERRTELVVRGGGDAGSLAGAVRAAVREADPSVPTGGIRSMSSVVREAYGTAWTTMGLLVAMALLATAIAALGIHALVANHVARGRREMGVRLALGAERSRLVGGMLASAVGSAALGVAAGWVLAAGAGRALRSLLFGVSALEPVAFVIPAAAVLAVSLVASLLPAVRAGRLAPAEVLRED